MEQVIYNVYYTGIIILFVELKHILLTKIIENSDFIGLNLPIATIKKEEVHIIILYFYKSNT